MRQASRARMLVFATLAALALVIGALGWGLTRRPALKVWQLPDGSTVTVEGITYGRQHRFLHGSAWQRLLLLVLPAPTKIDFMRRFRCRDTRFPSRGGESLAVWTFLHKASRTSFTHFLAVAVDEQGRESLPGQWGAATYLDQPPTERVDALELPSFPRRGKTVRLRIYNGGPGGSYLRIGELTVPNPAPGPHPTWTPEPFPIRKRKGDLEFTLTGLTTGLARKEVTKRSPSLKTIYGRPVAASALKVWTRADFRITRGGKPEPAWQPVGVTLADPTGNNFAPIQPAPSREAGAAHLYWGGELSPGEPVWKLRVEFDRTAGFASGELWTARGVAVPKPLRPSYFTEIGQRQGVTLQLFEIRSTLTYPNAPRRDRKLFTTALHTRLAPWAEGLHVTLVRAADELRELTIQPGGGFRGEYYFRIYSPVPITTVNLTFAVHKSRFIEFVAKPSRPADSAHRGPTGPRPG